MHNHQPEAKKDQSDGFIKMDYSFEDRAIIINGQCSIDKYLTCWIR